MKKQIGFLCSAILVWGSVAIAQDSTQNLSESQKKGIELLKKTKAEIVIMDLSEVEKARAALEKIDDEKLADQEAEKALSQVAKKTKLDDLKGEQLGCLAEQAAALKGVENDAKFKEAIDDIGQTHETNEGGVNIKLKTQLGLMLVDNSQGKVEQKNIDERLFKSTKNESVDDRAEVKESEGAMTVTIPTANGKAAAGIATRISTKSETSIDIKINISFLPSLDSSKKCHVLSTDEIVSMLTEMEQIKQSEKQKLVQSLR